MVNNLTQNLQMDNRTPFILGLCCFITFLVLPSWSEAFSYPEERRRIVELEANIKANLGKYSAGHVLKSFTDLYFDYTLLEYPEFATTLGHPDGNNRWTDNSLAAIERRRQDQVRFLDLIRSINRNELNASDQLNYDLMLRELDDSVYGQRFRGEYLAVTQLDGIHHSVPDMIAMMPSESVKHYEDILSRLSSTATLVENSIVLLKQGMKEGVTTPKVTIRDVPRQIKNLFVKEPLKSPLLDPFSRFPTSMTEADRERLKKRAVTIYRKGVKPAFRKFHDFIVAEYIPAARQSIALYNLPNGRSWYVFLLRKSTTTRMTPLSIHKLGVREVTRIHNEMAKVITDTGFKGDQTEFNRFLRSDSRFYFDNAEDLLSAYRAKVKSINSQIGKLFSKISLLGVEVLPVPAYAGKSKPAAYYQRGSIKAGRPGYYFVNTYDLKSNPKWGMEALTLHEAVPGHHLQISLQQDLSDLPWYRRYGGYTAYIEGWGLYAESLGYELGVYQDLYSRYGQLSYELWRAVRLVVDTGIHAMGWSRDQAIEYFKANTNKTEHETKVEVDRYIVWPTQALTYKIGELKIKELRKKAERILGENFDVRLFHDSILGGGAIPLDVLERRINAWIESMKLETNEKSQT